MSSNVFSGAEETFAYNRTLSRLREMSREAYWQRTVA